MDGDTVCIICNWLSNVFWPFLGVGALGAAAAATAAAGAFDPPGSDGGFSGRGASGTWPVPRGHPPVGPYWPDLSPIPNNVQYLYQTSADPETWAPYWPGISPIPKDGTVTPYIYDDAKDDIGTMYTPKAVEPITGLPIWPPKYIHLGGSSTAPAARG